MPDYILQHLTGPRRGVCHELNCNVILGRDEDLEINVPDTTVSRRHAELRVNGGAVWVHDLESQNGVFVNSRQIRSRRKLKGGDVLTLGKISFILLEDDSEGAAAVLAEPTRRFELGAEACEFSMIGESPAFHDCLRIAHRFAQAQLPILIQGETGTGKELVARWIHQLSGARGPYVAVNCSAVPPQLFESELFGVEKGAFTGATESKAGRFEQALNGSVFLDEIGELPLALQPKLLRVLEQRSVTRLGSDQECPIRCRIIAATNRKLHEAQAQGHFRSDLYHRLSALVLYIPSLRERSSDIELLAKHFAVGMAAKLGCEPPELMANAIEALHNYSWPGNIRELRNVVERAVVLADGPEIAADNLRLGRTPQCDTGLVVPLDLVERDEIAKALRIHDGNITHAAAALGISRPTLRRKMAHHGLVK